MTDAALNAEAAPLPPEREMAVDWAAEANGVEVPVTADAEKHGKLFKIAEKRREDVAGYLRHAAEGKGLDADFVHDLRVSVRRLSEVAGLLTVLMDKGSARAVEDSLKGLRKAAGELRDLDVTAEHLMKWRMPGPLKKCARERVEREMARRAALEHALRGTITSASVAGTMVLLARVLEEQGRPECVVASGTKLKRELDKRVAQRRKKLKRDFGKAARKQRAEVLHEARIAAKKLRYVVELEKELDEKGNKRELKFLKGMQELLGDHHDVHVIEEGMHKEVMARQVGAAKGLRPAWRKWHREMEKKQAHRAAEFFMRTYAFMNAGA